MKFCNEEIGLKFLSLQEMAYLHAISSISFCQYKSKSVAKKVRSDQKATFYRIITEAHFVKGGWEESERIDQHNCFCHVCDNKDFNVATILKNNYSKENYLLVLFTTR